MRKQVSMRYVRYRLYVGALLVLTVVFFLRAWRQVAHEVASLNTNSDDMSISISGAGYAADCKWNENGPLLYLLQHSVAHPNPDHWFHIAECFTGRRAGLKETIAGINGTVYMQVLDSRWMAGLSPMSRLLITAGLTSVGTETVHFLDADRASFSYLPVSKTPPHDSNANAHVETDAVVSTDQPLELRSARPSSGQVGLLRFKPQGGDFVMSVDQPLPERLTVSAGVVGRRTEDGGGQDLRGSAAGEFVRQRQGGGGGRGLGNGGGGGGEAAHIVEGGGGGEGGEGGSDYVDNDGGERERERDGDGAEGVVCVKYLSTIGRAAVQRVDWFPSREDAMSLRRAVDAYCPISWLRDGSQGGADSGDALGSDAGVAAGPGGRRYERRRAEGGGGGSAGDGGTRRLLVYQRDQNRKIMHSSQVVQNLREKLGPHGWSVEMMTHDESQHPCELVETMAGVDVVLTAHGFQSMLGLFMRPGAVLFEIFPHKYFKPGYAPMAEGLGVRHAFSESRARLPFMGYAHPTTETCMKWYLCRRYARSANVELDEHTLERLVGLALETRDRRQL